MSLIAADIHVSLGRKPILHGVSITARAGEITAIVGPNGSGKTTLLRSLTGELPCRGRITLNGQDMARMTPEELARRRGVLPQAAALSFPFTVAEVVRIGIEARGEHADALVPRALAAVDLAGFSGRLYQELSGGEQQRVQLARVLAQVWQPLEADGPRWLMLDEPVSSLDIAHQLTVMRLAAGYAQAGGGVVAVMHDLNLTALFAQNLVLMKGGRVLCQGRPEEVLTDEALSHAYGCSLRVNAVPEAGVWVLPHAAA
ncbi:heme ABC transporter ATP-binding protein [Paracoccus sp. PS-1]|uniref:heme ABC transporter ATP-binding protein n=1 Tax=unclassified Paracoccus (in: a-proteobacteria) TaxID=2688777 RepID=UPI0004B5BFC5|nr:MULTISPECIES: heme ABC transporter ATP-binding protein [unclassified Paracoccus (in: a-proteobacteria)]MDQ7263089.1 heme ABC transporter ATP-binding protein [Paracoccus sp. PS1]